MVNLQLSQMGKSLWNSDFTAINLQDPEAVKFLEYWIDFSNKRIRQQYQETYLNNLLHLKNQFIKNGADLLSIGTHDNYVPVLRQFFKKR